MDPQSSERRSFPARDLTSSGDDVNVSNTRGSAIRHLAILGSVLIPIAFLPYMITRRQLTTLRRRVDEMGATTALLKQRGGLAQAGPGGEVGASLAEMRQEIETMRGQLGHNDSQCAKSLADMTLDVIHINEELDQMRADILLARDTNGAPDERISRELQDGLYKIRQELQPSQIEATTVMEQLRLLRGEQEALRSELFKLADQMQSAQTGPQAMESSELRRLLQEARQTRATFGAIGSSLGDIATIIQRVEIEMGHERTGGYDPVERLRVLALRMQEETFGERVEKPSRGRGR
ncbi:hypothetical protein DFH09DRAFT_1130761 [Mycena vulgaris]|nr:hypothetical protein DFH09DRAFT_1130761 [Mycena vulgaris]